MITSPVNISANARKLVITYVAVAAVVLALMMGLGLLMRLSQANIVAIPTDLFYQILTAHGIGMVGIAGLSGSVIMWYFLNQYVKLTTGIFAANLVLFLIGVVFILGVLNNQFVQNLNGRFQFSC